MRANRSVVITLVVVVLAALTVSCASRRAPDRLPTWATATPATAEATSDEAGKRGPSGAMKALDYWGAQRAYPEATIPDEKYGQALEQARAMQAQFSATAEAGIAPWQPMGPANVGGRTLCIALHPADPDVIFAGSASGGLWKTTTGGVGAAAWTRVDTGYPVLGVSTIVIDPTDTDVMYIGTGEAYSYQDAIGGEVIRTTRGSYGVGILKSEDGGATWAPSLDWTYAQSRGVWMLQIHPTDSDVLYAATTEGVYKSTDAGASWDLSHGVIMAMDVRIHPTNPDIVFASHGNFQSIGVGIYRSTDGGQNWTKLTNGLPATWTGKAQLAIAATDPDTLFASIANTGGGIGLFKSVDGGDSWFSVNGTDYQQYQGWYAHYVVVSPFDEDTLFTGGIEIWRSTNGGNSLSKRSNWQSVFFGVSPPEGPIGGSDYAHADHHFAVWHPTEPNTIFFASDGGVFKSTDLGTSFQSLIGGYQTTQFYNGFSNSASDPDYAMGGLQDNFTVIYEGTNAWRRVIGGDGTWTAQDPLNGSTIYGAAQNLQMFRSTNGGNSWGGISPPTQAGDVTAFVAPYVLSHDNPAVLYAGRSRVYRSNNQGSGWFATNGSSPLSPANPVLSLATAETDADVAYAGTAPLSGPARVFRTQDGGGSWDDVTGSLPDRYPSDLAVDPNDANRVLVTFMGFGTSHVFLSTNAGTSWTDIGAGLPDIPTSAVEIDPDHPDVIYVGTDLGIYVTPDAGGSWFPFNDGMSLAMVNDLKVFGPDRKLRAATHGNGAWQRDLFDPGSCTTPGEATQLLVSHTGGVIGTTTLTWSAPTSPGTGSTAYDTVASSSPDDFDSHAAAACVESNDTDTTAVDTAAPASGDVIHYLIRAENPCGFGPVGNDSSGAARTARECPGTGIGNP